MVPVLVAVTVAVWALVLELMVLPMLHRQPSQMKPRPCYCGRSCCVPSDDAAAALLPLRATRGRLERIRTPVLGAGEQIGDHV